MGSLTYRGALIQDVIEQMALEKRRFAPFGCVRLDGKGRLLECNSAVAEIMGCLESDALQKCFFSELIGLTLQVGVEHDFRQAMQSNHGLSRHFVCELDPPQKIGSFSSSRSVQLRAHMFSATQAYGGGAWVITKRFSLSQDVERIWAVSRLPNAPEPQKRFNHIRLARPVGAEADTLPMPLAH